MIDIHPAKLAYLTKPDAAPILNVQTRDGSEIQRFELTRDQLLRLNAETADLLRDMFK